MINCMLKKPKTDLYIILFLSIFTLVVQLIFLNPPILSDQMEYYMTALRFPHMPFRPNIGSMRIGLILPVAVLYRIFGSAEVTYYAFPLMSSILLTISVYLIGKGLISRRVGILAALWLVFIPNLIQDAGHLLPDIPASAFASAAFALLITSSKRARPAERFPSGIILFAAGLLFGWSYLIKEYLAILFFLIPLLFWVLEIPYRLLLPVALGMLLMFGLEVAFGLVYYQNPLLRFLAAAPRETEGEVQKEVGRIVSFFGLLLVKSGGEGSLAIMLLGFINALRQSLRKEKAYLFLLLWAALIYILFTLAGLLPVIFNWEGTTLLRLHKFRYWIPILPPLVILGTAWLEGVFRLLSEKIIRTDCAQRVWLGGLISATLLLISWRGVLTIRDDPDFIRSGKDHYHELRAFLKENDKDIDLIWIDRDNKRAFERVLPIYEKGVFGQQLWHGSHKYINTDDLYLRAAEIDQGYIIIDRDFMVPRTYGVPQYLAAPPENWKLVFESENSKLALYQVQ